MTEPSSDEITGSTIEPRPGAGKGWVVRAGRRFGPARSFIESKRGVYAIVLGLLVAIAILSFLFGTGRIKPQFIPLYEADAEMLIVAAAVFVIAYEFEFKHREGK